MRPRCRTESIKSLRRSCEQILFHETVMLASGKRWPRYMAAASKALSDAVRVGAGRSRWTYVKIVASVCVFVEGEPVADLWAATRTRRKNPSPGTGT